MRYFYTVELCSEFDKEQMPQDLKKFIAENSEKEVIEFLQSAASSMLAEFFEQANFGSQYAKITVA